MGARTPVAVLRLGGYGYLDGVACWPLVCGRSVLVYRADLTNDTTAIGDTSDGMRLARLRRGGE